MLWKLIAPLTSASLSLASPAQDNCPKERAVSVPQSIDYGPSIACPGITYSIPGLTIQTATGCPLFVTVTPAHEVAERSNDLTQVRVEGFDPVKVFFFTCQTRYLLFVPLSSYCAYDHVATIGSVMHLTTAGCQQQ
jgi:hypothetical protein